MQLSVSHLGDLVEFQDAVAATAAGTSDVNGSAVDMDDAHGCLFAVGMGAIVSGAATVFKLQQSETTTTWADVTGATVTITDAQDDTWFLIDITRPKFTQRYLRGVVTRATQNSTIDAGVAIKYNVNASPTTNGATVTSLTKV